MHAVWGGVSQLDQTGGLPGSFARHSTDDKSVPRWTPVPARRPCSDPRPSRRVPARLRHADARPRTPAVPAPRPMAGVSVRRQTSGVRPRWGPMRRLDVSRVGAMQGACGGGRPRYPWSRGGPTVLSNGQALCREHNRSKSNLRPPWCTCSPLTSPGRLLLRSR